MKTLKRNLEKLPLSQLPTFCGVPLEQWRLLRLSSSVLNTATAMSSETPVGCISLSRPEKQHGENPAHSVTQRRYFVMSWTVRIYFL